MDFRATLTEERPPAVATSAALQALWYDARNDWKSAHDLLQSENEGPGAWVHAYLHRKEGDRSNAAYWYRRAGRPVATGDLGAEWTTIVAALLV